MSNGTTPAGNQSSKPSPENDEMWKTPRKGGYPESSPRSHPMKWIKFEEALLTEFAKIREDMWNSDQIQVETRIAKKIIKF